VLCPWLLTTGIITAAVDKIMETSRVGRIETPGGPDAARGPPVGQRWFLSSVCCCCFRWRRWWRSYCWFWLRAAWRVKEPLMTTNHRQSSCNCRSINLSSISSRWLKWWTNFERCWQTVLVNYFWIVRLRPTRFTHKHINDVLIVLPSPVLLFRARCYQVYVEQSENLKLFR